MCCTGKIIVSFFLKTVGFRINDTVRRGMSGIETVITEKIVVNGCTLLVGWKRFISATSSIATAITKTTIIAGATISTIKAVITTLTTSSIIIRRPGPVLTWAVALDVACVPAVV